jgi:ribosome biogenesis protein Tsr3
MDRLVSSPLCARAGQVDRESRSLCLMRTSNTSWAAARQRYILLKPKLMRKLPTYSASNPVLFNPELAPSKKRGTELVAYIIASSQGICYTSQWKLN